MITVYKFSTSHCGPCRMVKPVWDTVVKENPISNVDEYVEFVIDKDSAAMPYVDKFGVKQVPTFVITDEDKIVGTFTGNMSKEKLIKNIEEAIGNGNE